MYQQGLFCTGMVVVVVVMMMIMVGGGLVFVCSDESGFDCDEDDDCDGDGYGDGDCARSALLGMGDGGMRMEMKGQKTKRSSLYSLSIPVPQVSIAVPNACSFIDIHWCRELNPAVNPIFWCSVAGSPPFVLFHFRFPYCGSLGMCFFVHCLRLA